MLGRLDNVKRQFGVDIATGDPIVPSERNYEYKCLVSGEILPLKAYSLESIITEKLETVLARSVLNSRSKDYYDLYILRKTRLPNVDEQTLVKAFRETCSYRNFVISKDDAMSLMDEIANNKQIITRWANYRKNVKYTGILPFEDVVISIKEWIESIF